MVTIATYEKAEEARLAQCVLEGSGIGAFVEGDLLVDVAWIYSNAIGGVKVQVDPADVERATNVLAQAKMTVVPSSTEIPRCPECESQKVEYQRWSPTVFFLSLLLLGLPLPFLKRKYQCLDCLSSWK